MPLFTLHRNFVLRTTKGHAILFEKGKPTSVPDVCIEDAVAIGAVPENPKEGDVLGEEKTAEPSLPPAERKAKVFEAFATMKLRKERSDFTASGIPNTKRLPSLLGFEITTRERDDYWREFKAQEAELFQQADLDQKMENQKAKAKAKAEAE
jgi:hypothetical protein